MRAYKCDRCGKLFEKYSLQGTLEFFNVTRKLGGVITSTEYPAFTGDILDLCPDCNAELQKWVADGKEQAPSEEIDESEDEQ